MSTSHFFGNAYDDPIKIHYNDKTVHLSPDRLLGIKWIDSHGVRVLETSDNKNKFKQNYSDIPKSIFKHTESEISSNDAKFFKMPASYVKCTSSQQEDGLSGNIVEYDLDREDILWLKLINAKRQKIGCSLIDEINLEKAIDLLEKESQFQFSHSQQSNNLLPFVDNDAPCCICNDGEDSNANQIIFCDMCNIAVHQDCYGVPYIPEGQWLCRRCQLSPSISVNCILCPFTTGAFKQTADGRWVHVICALWLSEVHFANPVLLEPVEGVDRTLTRRQKLKCIICKNKIGACVQCSNRACSRSFHTTCAFYAGLKMKITETQSKKSADSIINRFAYCHEHSQIRPNDDISKSAWKREIQERFSKVRIKLSTDKKDTNNTVPLPMIPEAKIDKIASDSQIEHFSDILNYWSLKRKSRCGVPLIRRLQVYFEKQKPILVRHLLDDVLPATNEPGSSSLVSSTQQQQQIDPKRQLAYLRRDFERIRLLCELVKKREKLKINAISAIEGIVKKFKPLLVILNETLQKLIEIDHSKIFTQPVDMLEVPGYYSIITHPMDFQEMQRRLNAGNYKKVFDLRRDFLLMMKNCDTFNKDNKYFYLYGKRIRSIGMNVINSAELEATKISQLLPLIGLIKNKLSLLNENSLDNLRKEYNCSQQRRHSHTPKKKIQFNNRDQKTKSDTEEKQQSNQRQSIGRKKGISNKKLSSATSNINTPLMSDITPIKNRKTRMLQHTHKNLFNNKDDNKKQRKNYEAEFSANKLRKKGKSLNNLSKLRQQTRTSVENLEEENKRTDGKTTMNKKHQNVAEENNTMAKSIQCSRDDTQIINKLTTPIQNDDNNCNINTRAKRSIKKRKIDQIKKQQTDENDMANKRIKFTTDQIQQRNLLKCTPGRGVAKQSYDAYLTEASSAADEGDSEIDVLFFPSLDGSVDELPSIDTNNRGKRQTKIGIQRHQKQAYRKSPPSVALHNKFRHNDIVWAKLDNNVLMPARVIDLLIRYDIDDSNGFGSHFVQKALQERPKDYSEYTLVMLFDKQNTWYVF